jgi:hypothetical protein
MRLGADLGMVFGMNISNLEVGKALCPQTCIPSDHKGLAEVLADVAAMPGLYQKSISVEHSDLEVAMKEAVAMAAQMNGAERSLVDSQWKQECKNTLLKIKTKENLPHNGNEIYKAEPMFSTKRISASECNHQ